MQLLVRTFLSASRVNTIIPIMAKKLHDENRFLQARDPEFVRELTAAQALEILERNDYFNPHLLVSTPLSEDSARDSSGRFLNGSRRTRSTRRNSLSKVRRG